MEEWQRRSFKVRAMRVTAENQKSIAEWCGGTIQSRFEFRNGKPYIEVPIYGAARTWENMAFVGDWVFKSLKGFKVYRHKSFMSLFEKVPNDREQRETVKQLVKEAMGDDYVSSYYGQKDDVASAITDKIMGVLK